MLNTPVIYLLLALVAAVFGFGVLSGVAASALQIAFVVFFVAFLASLSSRAPWL